MSKIELKLKLLNDNYGIIYMNEPFDPNAVKQVENLFEGVTLYVYPEYIVVVRSEHSYLKPEYRSYFPESLNPHSNPVPWLIIAVAVAIAVLGLLAYFVPEFREWLKTWIERFLYLTLVGFAGYLGVEIGKALFKKE